MKKILITGAAGFIGSHLCDKFISQGYRVIAVDNLITGRLENIEHLLELKNFEFINHDIINPLDIKGDINEILHLACPASPKDYYNYPIETLQVSSIGTNNILELAKDKNARILISSTSEVYGNPLEHPQKENYWGNVNPIGERSVYDEAKRFQEALTMAYARTHDVSVRIARIFNTYGNRMKENDGRALPNFFSQAMTGKPITIFGDGLQTRSFCYIDDLVEGICLLLKSDYALPVNLGNPEEVTILDLAQEVVKLVDSNSKIVYKPLPEDDPKVRCPDISKAKEILGWQPRTVRSLGLKKMYESLKNG